MNKQMGHFSEQGWHCWCDIRNGKVHHHPPTASMGSLGVDFRRFKNPAQLARYQQHCEQFGKEEALVIYFDSVPLNSHRHTESYVLDTESDEKCEQISRPARWTQQLSRKDFLALGRCDARKIAKLGDGYSFLDDFGQRWWKIIGNSPLRRDENQPRILYCR